MVRENGGREGGPKRAGKKVAGRPYRKGGGEDRRPRGRPDGRGKGNGPGSHPGRQRSDRKGGRPEREERRGPGPGDGPGEPRKPLLPQDASRLLYRGIDCLEKGDTDLAMVMFLHGSVMMSEGCENNADRILGGIGKSSFTDLRARIGPQCSESALVEYDYLCMRRDSGTDRKFFDSEYSKGNTHAIYRRICLGEVEADDPIIDEFASRYPDDGKKVMKGLELLKRKKDSESAAGHLGRIEDGIRLRQSVYVMFTRAMNGDARAVKELEENSDAVPEAAFFSEFLSARADGNGAGWLRSKYPQYKDLIISRQGEFKIQDDPFGMFLKAKSLEMKDEEYMSMMMNAARAGSPEAIDELSKRMYRNDVRKCLAGIYLKDGDIANLVSVYQAGLDDMYYLEQYCCGDPGKILDVGRELGRRSAALEIDWLKDHCDRGMGFCRQALVDMSHDDSYRSKKMVYALHDIGADREAAELYFEMEGDPNLPSVKWLRKVCGSDDVREYVRRHYEERGDSATFDSIFEDDGYAARPKRSSGGTRRSSGRPSGRKPHKGGRDRSRSRQKR